MSGSGASTLRGTAGGNLRGCLDEAAARASDQVERTCECRPRDALAAMSLVDEGASEQTVGRGDRVGRAQRRRDTPAVTYLTG